MVQGGEFDMLYPCLITSSCTYGAGHTRLQLKSTSHSADGRGLALPGFPRNCRAPVRRSRRTSRSAQGRKPPRRAHGLWMSRSGQVAKHKVTSRLLRRPDSFVRRMHRDFPRKCRKFDACVLPSRNGCCSPHWIPELPPPFLSQLSPLTPQLFCCLNSGSFSTLKFCRIL